MRIVLERLLTGGWLILSCFVSPAALAGYREDSHATSIEIAQLPKFCWEQFEVPGAQGEEFSIRNCGPGANHYCQGVLGLIRGKKSPNKATAVGFFLRADDNVAYTERSIAPYPKCSIREHVEATRAEINHLLRMYGSKPAAR